MINSLLQGRKHPAMIDRTQGMHPVTGFGRQTTRVSSQSLIEQLPQETAVHIGHIASHNQIPFAAGMPQSREYTAHRPNVFHQIGKNRISQTAIPLRRADQRDMSSGFANASGDSLHQRDAVQLQQCLVATHPGAPPARQHESRARIWAAAVHEKMVASIGKMLATCRQGNGYPLVLENKTVYICSLVLLVMLAASPMRAADSAAVSPLLANPASQGKVSVVRVDRRTGKLTRTVLDRATNLPASAASAPAPQPPAKIKDLVEKSAQANGVDPLLVHSVIQEESGYNRYAMSPKGAEGLMQLMPSTARMLGVGNSFDEEQNIEAGVKYLKYLQTVYKDDRLALAAYNAGPKSVDRFKQVPPYPETQAYVERVEIGRAHV